VVSPNGMGSEHEITWRLAIHLPTKAQRGLMLRKNIQVMVPRFQVKFCEKRPTFEILQCALYANLQIL
jgi:hypothetical protein